MQNIEEGTPLVAEQQIETPQSSNKKSLIALFSIVVLAVIGAVGYVSMGSRSSLVTTQLDTTNVSYPASVGNAAEKAKCIGDAIMGPHSYLDGKILEYKDPEDEWTTVVKFGTDVKKVVYNNDGSIKKSVSLGTFKGIDQEANLVFADGDTCTEGSGPNYGRVGVRCGKTTEIAEIIRRSTCRFVIRVNTGEQCAYNYNRYGSDEEQHKAVARVNKIYEDYRA